VGGGSPWRLAEQAGSLGLYDAFERTCIKSHNLHLIRNKRIILSMSTATPSMSRRTTVTLSVESQGIVERFKNATGVSTSSAIDQLIQRSEQKPSRLKNVNGFFVLDLPAGPQRHFTIEDLKQIEDDMDREYVERILPRKKKTTATNRKRRASSQR
jgi:hypothetical protein